MASEIRVDKINSLSGVGTVTLSPTGVDIAGITTAATLKATTGIVTTLTATTGIATHFTADKISLPDSSDGSLCIGIGSDLKLNHNGTDSFITEVGGGDLYIQGNDIIMRDAGTLEKHIEMTQNGAVDIYHNGTKKLETTSTGATLSGNLSIDANLIHNGDTDTMLSFSADNQVDIQCASTRIGRFTTNGLALGDNKRLDIFDASGDRSGLINNSDSGANALRISADPDNTGSSSSLQFHVDGTERARVDSTGDVTISDGDLVIGTSGHGIDFSATGGGSNTSNESELFSDYEQGSCTVLIHDASGSNISVTGGNHKYTLIGNKVFVEGQFTFAESGSKNGGLMQLYQLPFTPAQVSPAGGNYWYDGPSDATDVTGLVYVHTNGTCYLKQSTTQGQNSNQKYLTFNEIAANSNRILFVSFYYTV